MFPLYVSAKEAVEAGKNPIVIDNTNVQAWEMKAYVALVRNDLFHIHYGMHFVIWIVKMFLFLLSGKKERLPH